jgi:hypothetical protein
LAPVKANVLGFLLFWSARSAVGGDGVLVPFRGQRLADVKVPGWGLFGPSDIADAAVLLSGFVSGGAVVLFLPLGVIVWELGQVERSGFCVSSAVLINAGVWVAKCGAGVEGLALLAPMIEASARVVPDDIESDISLSQ